MYEEIVSILQSGLMYRNDFGRPEEFLGGDNKDEWKNRNKMVTGVNGVGDRANVLFSAIPFPGSEYCMEFVREETEGFVYRWEDEKLQGWVSPSLRSYFPDPPSKIYLQLLPGE